MVSSADKNRFLRRASRELQPGLTVNLGIGLPTLLVDYLEQGFPVCLHSENGIAGQGPAVPYERADRNLIDAGGAYVSVLPGTSFFDSATSFALVRGGRLDLTILGALEVAGNGDLANWTIPGRFTPGVGGGMELAQKARRVVVLCSHTDKRGQPKLVRQCSLPLTAPACVDRIYTDMAVIDIGPEGMVLREVAEECGIEEVVAATGAPLVIRENEIGRF
jgi:3-oxoacid CoA-transferase subunit B